MKPDARSQKSEAGGQRPEADLRLPTSGLRPPTSGLRTPASAFSLLEVMFAIGIFFMAMFAILGVVSGALRNARALRRIAPDAGMVAAELCVQFANTNQVFEGVGSGDFGHAYPDYSYTWDLYEVQTNHLCELDIVVQRRSGQQPVESQMSINLFLPNLKGGSLSGPVPR